MANCLSTKKGVILLTIIVISILLFAVISFTYSIIKNTETNLDLELGYHSQTMNIARAGLADALSYFRRQTTQPVTTFSPQLDPGAEPPINETDDPSIGIVREFEVCGLTKVWGRYEVPKELTKDISSERGNLGAGTVWEITSIGYTYVKNQDGISYDTPPNRILYKIKMTTEIRRLTIVPPSLAAICTQRPQQTEIGNRAKVAGYEGVGIVYPAGVGTPNIQGEVTGTPATSALDPYYDSVEYVFGVSESELRAMADINVASGNELPNPIPEWTLVFIDGNATFNDDRPLSTTALIYCTGDLTINENSNSFFNGLIYVKGSYEQNAPSLIKGCIISTGNNLKIQGSGDYSEVNCDQGIIDELMRRMGQYRFSKGVIVYE